jgi:hypothetical protein
MNTPGQAQPHGGAGIESAADGPGSGPAAGREAADPPTTHLFLGPGCDPGPSRSGSAEEPGPDREWLEAISQLPATSALLRVGAGGSGGRFLLNTERTTVGRHLGSHIFLDHATVSRSHAVFERRGTEFRVRDLGSLNGTYVNGLVVDTAVLRTGDRIQIGKFAMVFHQNPAKAPHHPATPQAGPAADPHRPRRPESARETSPATSASTPGRRDWPASVRRACFWLTARRRRRTGE